MNQTKAARDYMTTDVITVTPETDIHLAIRLLVDNKISGVPVTSGAGDLVGILSTRDCLKVAFSTSYHQDSGGAVRNYMSNKVECIDADTDVIEVADRFLKSQYRRFPVIENGRLSGLISRYDVLKALADLW